MKQCIDIYTGLHSDNIKQEQTGSAFGLVLAGKVTKQTRGVYDKDKTYMQLWFASMAPIIRNIANGSAGYDSVTLFIHTWTPNLNKILKKLQSILDQMKDYDEASWPVIDIKLRKSNQQKYEYHDDMKDIMLHLLQLNKMVPTDVKFCVTSPTRSPEMLVAYQHAKLAMEDDLTS